MPRAALEAPPSASFPRGVDRNTRANSSNRGKKQNSTGTQFFAWSYRPVYITSETARPAPTSTGRAEGGWDGTRGHTSRLDARSGRLVRSTGIVGGRAGAGPRRGARASDGAAGRDCSKRREQRCQRRGDPGGGDGGGGDGGDGERKGHPRPSGARARRERGGCVRDGRVHKRLGGVGPHHAARDAAAAGAKRRGRQRDAGRRQKGGRGGDLDVFGRPRAAQLRRRRSRQRLGRRNRPRRGHRPDCADVRAARPAVSACCLPARPPAAGGRAPARYVPLAPPPACEDAPTEHARSDDARRRAAAPPVAPCPPAGGPN